MHTRSSVVLRLAAASIVAVAVSAAVGPSATAHSQLTGSDPEPGSAVEAPTQVVLTFNEELIQVGSQISVADAQGMEAELEVQYPEPHIAAADLPALAAGPATVTWRVVSADGHPLEGVIEFEVTVAPEPSPSVTPSPETTATPSPEPTASATPISVPMPEPGGGVPPWLWGALALAVAGATAIAVFSVRKR